MKPPMSLAETARLFKASLHGRLARTKKPRDHKRTMRRIEKNLQEELGFEVSTRWKKRHFTNQP